MELDRRSLLGLGLGLVGVAALPQAALAATAAARDLPDIQHGKRTSDAVALTFHGAGSPALAQKILGIVKAHGAQVSVMAIGAWLDANPSMAKAILDGGHDLGNHTMHHKPMRTLDAKTANAEVAQCAAVLKRLTGTQGRWFRPSGTPTSNTIIRAAARTSGYTQCISYDVDSLDYTDPKPSAIVRTTMATVKGGSIVSLHLGHPNTAKALPTLLDDLAAAKLRPVTLTTLLSA